MPDATHSIKLTDSAGTIITDATIYIYQHGIHNNENKRISVTDENSNGIYHFNVDHDNLKDATSFDVCVNPADPPSILPEYDSLPLTSLIRLQVLLDHKDSTSNPHSTTLTQSITADSLDANVNPENLVKLVDGSNCSTLHKHSATASQEVVGTGDGETKAFSFTLANTPVIATTVSITDGVETFTDDGAGVLTGDATPPGSGTINYATGEVSLEFNANVGDGVDIVASYSFFYTGKINASNVPIIDNGNYYVAENVEDALQEIGETSLYTPAVPENLALEELKVKTIGGDNVERILAISGTWDEVSHATSYDVIIKDKTHNFTWNQTVSTEYFRSMIWNNATYGVKVRSRRGNKVSAWCSEVEINIGLVLLYIDPDAFSILKTCVNTLTVGTQIASAYTYLYGPDSTSDEHIGTESGEWSEVIEQFPFSRASGYNRIHLTCNFGSTVDNKAISLKIKITYPDESTEESLEMGMMAGKVATVSTNIVHQIEKNITGLLKLDVYYKGTAGENRPKVNSLAIKLIQ